MERVKKLRIKTSTVFSALRRLIIRSHTLAASANMQLHDEAEEEVVCSSTKMRQAIQRQKN